MTNFVTSVAFRILPVAVIRMIDLCLSIGGVHFVATVSVFSFASCTGGVTYSPFLNCCASRWAVSLLTASVTALANFSLSSESNLRWQASEATPLTYHHVELRNNLSPKSRSLAAFLCTLTVPGTLSYHQRLRVIGLPPSAWSQFPKKSYIQVWRVALNFIGYFLLLCASNNGSMRSTYADYDSFCALKSSGLWEK